METAVPSSDPVPGHRPDRPTHLADLVARNASERPGHDAVRDLSGAAPLTLTWSAFDAAVSAEALDPHAVHGRTAGAIEFVGEGSEAGA